MKKYYHGAGKCGPYFEGWYLRHQTKEGDSLALIPALHINGEGRRSASLQVITDQKAWWLEYPVAEFCANEGIFQVQMGQNRFSHQEICLNVEQNDLSLHGALRYGPFASLRSDIMGPFRFLSAMECSHGVISMGHSLEGTLVLNGKAMDFSGGTGYIETDRGRSFPSAYLWTQCAWQDAQPNSLMLSIATIPLPVGSFTGCICAVLYHGREYRLATYRGVRIERWSDTGAVIRQGKYRLEAALRKGQGHPLQAPVEGSMSRTIRESLCAQICYRFWQGETLLFEHTDHHASFEYSDERKYHAKSTAT